MQRLREACGQTRLTDGREGLNIMSISVHYEQNKSLKHRQTDRWKERQTDIQILCHFI